MRAIAYNVLMAKGDIFVETISDFSRGLNLIDDPAELSPGYLYPSSKNVQPVGRGNALGSSAGHVTLTLASPGFSPNGFILEAVNNDAGPGGGDIYFLNSNGSVSNLKHNLGLVRWDYTSVVIAANSGRLGLKAGCMAISYDSTLSTSYLWVVNQSAVGDKVNLGTGVVSTWGGTPPFGSLCISWKSRMIISGNLTNTARLYFSDPLNPESWPTNNFIDIKSTDDDQEPIVGLAVAGENLIVIKQRSVWVVFDSTTFDNRRIGSVGAVSSYGITNLLDRVYFRSIAGLYSTDGEELRYESHLIDSVFRDTNTPFSKISSSNSQVVANPQFGQIVVYDQSSGSCYVGYDELRDPVTGQMPWFFFSALSSVFGRILMVNHTGSWAADATGSGPSLTFIGGQAGTQVFHATNMFGLDLPKYIFNGSTLSNIDCDAWLPVVHGPAKESVSRLRRVNINGSGSLSSIEAYVDPFSSAAFTAASPTFTNNFLRVRPEVRGKNFLLRVRNQNSGLTNLIRSTEVVLRRAGL